MSENKHVLSHEAHETKEGGMARREFIQKSLLASGGVFLGMNAGTKIVLPHLSHNRNPYHASSVPHDPKDSKKSKKSDKDSRKSDKGSYKDSKKSDKGSYKDSKKSDKSSNKDSSKNSNKDSNKSSKYGWNSKINKW